MYIRSNTLLLYTSRIVTTAYISQRRSDPVGKKPRHGLTARLECDANVGAVFITLIPRTNSSPEASNEGFVMD
jgi:hypothetical protein